MMKKIICIAATGVILIGCVLVSALSGTKQSEQTPAAYAQSSSGENRYIIKSEYGRLVVYRKGDETPFMTTETLSGTLPKSDAEKLRQGIEVEGTSNLRKTLEDYCS